MTAPVSAAPVTLLGGEVHTLVAAADLLAAGEKVIAWLPRQRIGGGIAPFQPEHTSLPLGFRLLELDYEESQAPPRLEEYRPGCPGHRPFIRVVAGYLEDLVGDAIVTLPPTRMWTRGRIVPDILHTVDLSPLPAMLDSQTRRRVCRELRENLHKKDTAPLLLGEKHPIQLQKHSYAAVSRANHGATFDKEFITPVAEKILPGQWQDVPADLRRKIWMPLFYPATLQAACENKPLSFRPHRPYSRLQNGNFDLITQRLLARISTHPHADIHWYDQCEGLAPARKGIHVRLDGASHTISPPVLLGLPPEHIFTAAGIPCALPKARVVVVWAEVETDNTTAGPELLLTIDKEIDIHRVSFAPSPKKPGRLLLVTELRGDLSGDPWQAAENGLRAMGVVRKNAPLHRAGCLDAHALPVPSFAARAAFNKAKEGFTQLGLQAHLFGAAEIFGANNLNEQIMQGITIARSLS